MNEIHTAERASREDADQPENREPVELIARIEQLETELEDIHARYQRFRQSQYRRTALTLGLIGLATIAGALAFPGSREVLFALGGTGLFAAVLIYYLTPERFIPADVGEHVYEALASNQAAIVAELGLCESRVYLPLSSFAERQQPKVRLFVPQRVDYSIPPDDALTDRFVITDNEAERGMSFEPSASELLVEFEQTLSSGLSESPSHLATQLVDAVVNGFEIVDTATPEVSRNDGRARFSIDGSAYTHVDHFDNPVASFLAAGLAAGLDRRVTVTVMAPGDRSPGEYIVTCEWPADESDTRKRQSRG